MGLKSKLKGFFITGTDTEIGKTIITTALTAFLQNMGINALPIKPIETGCQKTKETLMPNDGLFYKNTLDLPHDLDTISPIRFENPLCPMAACNISGKDIHMEPIIEHIEKVSKKHDAIIVEGIGGIMVPIKEKYFVYDLIKSLELPVIIVSRNALGMINHTLLTVDFVLKMGFKCVGVIINSTEAGSPNIAQQTNPDVLKKLLSVPVLGMFPHIGPLNYTSLTEGMRNINCDIIKKYL